ncbi:GNAT family N-acetyltransferase [Natronomonas sp. EA1]|uniref:GNAT family N-acetyltransferase n=1 Tax=Natronomonas sp. EA1 TaxID=3421655 RepID=UPI003EB6E376
MATAVRVRPYRPGDQEGVLALGRSSGGLSPGLETDAADLATVSETYLASGGAFVVAEGEDGLVAMGGVLADGEGSGRIRRLRVADPDRAFDLGQAVLLALEGAASERDIERLVAESPDGAPAAPLYEATGYLVEGREEREDTRWLTVEKRLTRRV